MADDKTSLVAGNKKDLEGGIYYEQTPATVCIIIIHISLYFFFHSPFSQGKSCSLAIGIYMYDVVNGS